MNNLTMDKLLNIIKDFEDSQPQFNNAAIDDMISIGHKIENLVMVHSIPELRDTRKVKTKHGYIETLFNRHLEYGTAYVMMNLYDKEVSKDAK